MVSQYTRDSLALNQPTLDKEYDKLYPVGKNDTYRVCAMLKPAHINLKDKIVIRYRQCGVRFQQWSPLQNSEPWSLCWLCADELTNPKKYKKKKKDKKDD